MTIKRSISKNTQKVYQNTFRLLGQYDWMFNSPKEVESMVYFPNRKYYLVRSLCVISFLFGSGSFPMSSFFTKAYAGELFKGDVQPEQLERLRSEFCEDIEKIEGESCMSLENRRNFLIEELMTSLQGYSLSIYELLQVISCLIQTDNLTTNPAWNTWLMEQLSVEKIAEFAVQVKENKTRININKPKLFFALIEASCEMKDFDSSRLAGFLLNLNQFLRSFESVQNFGMISNCLLHLIKCEARLSTHKEAVDAYRLLLEEVWLPSISKEIDEAFDFTKDYREKDFLRRTFFEDFLKQGKTGRESNKFKKVVVGIPAYRRLIQAMNFCRIFKEDCFAKFEQIFMFLCLPSLNDRLPEALQKDYGTHEPEKRKFIVAGLLSMLGRGNYGINFVRSITDLEPEGNIIEDIELANSAFKCLISHLNFGHEDKKLTCEQLICGEKKSWQWLDGFVTDMLFRVVQNARNSLELRDKLIEGLRGVSFLTSKDFLCTVKALHIFLHNEQTGKKKSGSSKEFSVDSLKIDNTARANFYDMLSVVLCEKIEGMYEIKKVNLSKLSTISKVSPTLAEEIEKQVEEKLEPSPNQNLIHSDLYIKRLDLHIEVDGEVHRVHGSESQLLTWQTRMRNFLLVSMGKKILVVSVKGRVSESRLVAGIVKGIDRMRDNPDLAYATINL